MKLSIGPLAAELEDARLRGVGHVLYERRKAVLVLLVDERTKGGHGFDLGERTAEHGVAAAVPASTAAGAQIEGPAGTFTAAQRLNESVRAVV
jgi:hypothetical protein